MKPNFDQLRALIAGQLERAVESSLADLDLAATAIATGLIEAVAVQDEESAQELVEQLELLGEIQRLRLSNEIVAALRETLTFAVGVLFSFIPLPGAPKT